MAERVAQRTATLVPQAELELAELLAPIAEQALARAAAAQAAEPVAATPWQAAARGVPEVPFSFRMAKTVVTLLPPVWAEAAVAAAVTAPAQRASLTRRHSRVATAAAVATARRGSSTMAAVAAAARAV